VTDNAYEPTIVRVPLPADFEDERDEDVLSRANTLCATAERLVELMVASGQNPAAAVSEENQLEARDIFSVGPASLPPANVLTGTALHLTALLTTYDMAVVQDAQQLRNFCTNILIEKAAKGKTESVQLRAVELLGKIKDVGLFEERSSILIGELSTDDIKSRIKDKIGRLRQLAEKTVDAEVVDITPPAPSPPKE
jgi:hypothetical protein